MIIPRYGGPAVINVFFIALCLKEFQFVRSACSSLEWECDNGECIKDDKQCNGKVDCSDRSDEIAENCIQFHESCQEFAFACIYGACISGDARCNGVQDCADNSDELICNTKTDSDFQGNCTQSEMQCLTSRECIKSTLLCDGIAHCKDGSDEAIEVCISYVCDGFGFQCGSGACISGNARCNGAIDCVDGSDEAWALCETPRKKNRIVPTPTPKPKPVPTPTPTKPVVIPSPELNCFLPNFPELQNLRFKLHPQNHTIELGTSVEEYETIHIECRNGGTLRGEPSLLCRKGEFNHDFPTCDSFCDGRLLNRLSLRAICDNGEEFVRCPEKIAPGTFIQVKCAYGFSRIPNTPQNLNCLPNGHFDQILKRCDMNCGRIAHASTSLSKEGFQVHISNAPWHIAIYEDHRVYYNYICGGSIISPTVIISAAHCFWDEANQIQKNSTRYQIIAGRSSSNYSTEQSDHSQVVKVLEVHIPEQYAGRDQQQREDIAFMKLEMPLKFSETVAPICLPKDLSNAASRYMTTNRPGFIHGFGERNQLERINMKTLAYHDCITKTPDAPVADDKFCAYTVHDALVCRGDSGGGFSIGKTDIDTGVTRYNLWGVISNTPTTKNDCTRTGEQSYVAITNIFHARSSFKRNLTNARRADEELF